jgi:hypothetical protein
VKEMGQYAPSYLVKTMGQSELSLPTKVLCKLTNSMAGPTLLRILPTGDSAWVGEQQEILPCGKWQVVTT